MPKRQQTTPATGIKNRTRSHIHQSKQKNDSVQDKLARIHFPLTDKELTLSARTLSLFTLAGLLLVSTGKLMLLQGSLLLPRVAAEAAEPLLPLIGIVELCCFWMACQLLTRLNPQNRSLTRVLQWLIGLLLVLELSHLLLPQLSILVLLFQAGEMVLLLLMARAGLRLPQGQELKMLFQGVLLLVCLRLLAGAWLDRLEGGQWLHLLPCDNPLCQSLLTGLQVLPLLLLASALFHCGKGAAQHTSASCP